MPTNLQNVESALVGTVLARNVARRGINLGIAENDLVKRDNAEAIADARAIPYARCMPHVPPSAADKVNAVGAQTLGVGGHLDLRRRGRGGHGGRGQQDEAQRRCKRHTV